jgi:ribose transport system permease protein
MTAIALRRRNLIQRSSRYASLTSVAAIILVVLCAGVTTPGFLTVGNALVIVRAASMTGIVALGMSYVTISGNLFALSSGSLGACLAVVFALVTPQAGVVAGFAAVLVSAILAGIFQGAAINLTGNPIIATLAFGAAFRGLASILSGDGVLRIHTGAASWIGTARPLGIPTQSWAFGILTAMSWLIIRKARIGRQIILSGANRETAVGCGIRVDVITCVALIALSLGVACVAIFTVAQFSEARANLFEGYDFDYIAAVLVGGIALRGGQGSPLQAAFGAILIALLENFMLLNNVSGGMLMTVVGSVVVAATSGFHLVQRRNR